MVRNLSNDFKFWYIFANFKLELYDETCLKVSKTSYIRSWKLDCPLSKGNQAAIPKIERLNEKTQNPKFF